MDLLSLELEGPSKLPKVRSLDWNVDIYALWSIERGHSFSTITVTVPSFDRLLRLLHG